MRVLHSLLSTIVHGTRTWAPGTGKASTPSPSGFKVTTNHSAQAKELVDLVIGNLTEDQETVFCLTSDSL